MTVFAAAALTAMAGAPPLAEALPEAPEVFCDTYPEAPACAGAVPDCTTCHTSPPARNAFGQQLAQVLLPEEARPLDVAQFTSALPDALMAIESDDADGDGYSNIAEILAGSLPADSDSFPVDDECPQMPAEHDWQYNVCDFDPAYVLNKLSLDFCGRSASREDKERIATAADPVAELHAALDVCLDSQYWIGMDGAVWNLANKKIKPLQAFKAGDGAGDIPIADYFDDYKLFVYTQIDDHDARDALLAQYFVDLVDGDTPQYVVRETSDSPQPGPAFQAVQIERRAGMITTRWVLSFHTMGSAIPRGTAALMYRSYLGHDIAQLEGLHPIANEPVDYDEKGVGAPECAVCHTTLDPLAYPFARYGGILGQLPTQYNPTRLGILAQRDGIPSIADVPDSGALLGKPVADLLEWVEVASDSDDFARATALDYWRLVMGQEPSPDETAEFTALWHAFIEVHDYRVERMLHDLIDTEAYRVP